jgi:hypothetical protein
MFMRIFILTLLLLGWKIEDRGYCNTSIPFPLSSILIPKDTILPWKFITLDPGHFHAALVQKSMYPEVDYNVHVYAPKGNDVKLHLSRIGTYNSRATSPTSWKEIVYEGDDFFSRMLAEKKGNIVMLAGNNKKKTEYILSSIKAGFNVYADKPMVITANAFPMLEEAFTLAGKKKLLIYDHDPERPVYDARDLW